MTRKSFIALQSDIGVAYEKYRVVNKEKRINEEALLTTSIRNMVPCADKQSKESEN